MRERVGTLRIGPMKEITARLTLQVAVKTIMILLLRCFLVQCRRPARESAWKSFFTGLSMRDIEADSSRTARR
jgi:hypothetical protein